MSWHGVNDKKRSRAFRLGRDLDRYHLEFAAPLVVAEVVPGWIALRGGRRDGLHS